DGDAPRSVESGLSRQTTVAAETGDAGSRHGRDAAVWRKSTDALVSKVREEEAAVGSDGSALGYARVLLADDARDDASRRYVPNKSVAGIRNEEPAVRSHGNVVWLQQIRPRCRAAIPEIAAGRATRESRDDRLPERFRAALSAVTSVEHPPVWIIGVVHA